MFERLKYLKEPEYYRKVHVPFLKIRESSIGLSKTKTALNFFKVSFDSILEMLHYLFLHDVSIFKGSLKEMNEKNTKEIVYQLLGISISAQLVSDELPDIEDSVYREILNVISKIFRVKEEEVEKKIKNFASFFGKKRLYEELYTAFIKELGRKRDLEESMTFGILLNQMINDCLLRAKKKF